MTLPTNREAATGGPGGKRSGARGAPPPCVPPGSRTAFQGAVLCLSLGLATLAVYWAAGGNGFVDYDDADYVTANPHVAGRADMGHGGLGVHDRPCEQLASGDVAVARAGLRVVRPQGARGHTGSAWLSTWPTRCCCFSCSGV